MSHATGTGRMPDRPVESAAARGTSSRGAKPGPRGSGCARSGAAAGLYAEQGIQAADRSRADSGADAGNAGQCAEGQAAKRSASVSGESVRSAAADRGAGAASVPQVQLPEVPGEQ